MHNKNNKFCECSYCLQFYFIRIKKYSNDKNILNNKSNQFTLDDLDNVTLLKSMNYENEKISKHTNLTKSVVNHIVKLLDSPKQL